MRLVESKLVDLDTDINQYLLPTDQHISHPFYPLISITLRRLLSHSASIRRNQAVEFTLFQPGDKALTETTLAEACFMYLSHNASNWLPYPPGTVTLYSNVGSSLAALVVERVTKISYEEYIKEKILKPLAIDTKKAGFRLSDIEDKENLVKHYAFDASHLHEWNQALPQLNITQTNIPNWLYIPYYSVSIYPAGLLRISAHSLSLYLRMFMNNGSSLLRPQSIVEIRTPVTGVVLYRDPNTANNESSLPVLEFGISWYWRTADDGHRYLGHGGKMSGATNMMLINKKGDIGVITLTNADVFPDNDLSIKISETLDNIRQQLFDCFEN